MNKFMDIDAKNRACRAVLTMAVFLLPAVGTAGEQGPQRRDALFEFELHEQWLVDVDYFYTEPDPVPPEPEPEPAPAPEPTPYPDLPDLPILSPLTTAPGPTPGDTLLPEHATYYRAPADLILPDERLSDEAFRQILSYYLPSFGGNRPEQILDDFRFQYLYGWDLINAAHAYARGLSGRGVRIGIDDYGVDILHAEFAGRVQRTGSFLTRKIPTIYGPDDLAEAFSACSNEAANCRVFEIDASGDRALIEHYAHRIIEAERRFPDAYNTWFIRDLSRGADGWHAFPGLYGEINRPLGPQPKHGTIVASVAAGWRYGIAPGATIVPLLGVELLSFAGGAILTGDDASKAQAYRDFLSHSDIINYSVAGGSYDSEVSKEAWYKRDFPALWAAFTQRDAREKTIMVWAAGNASLDRSSPAASLPLREPAVRGHWLAVAAAYQGQISFYSNRCGPLPDDWNPQAHGRHYCLTAPTLVRVAYPNFNPETDPEDADVSLHWLGDGTSHAAPVVSGGIALVMERFRGQLSNREVALRVINTANNTGIYADAAIYGAGMLDLDAATAPVGEVSTGTASLQSGLHRTRLATPPAWGRVGRHLAGREVAGFDEWNAPFWQPAASLFATVPAPQAVLPMPGWDEGFEQRALLSHLRWFGASGAGREDGLRMTLWGDNVHAAGFRGDFPGRGFAAETDYHAFGFSGAVMERLRLGVIVETQTNQGARPAGAFGAAANSKLVWLAREHAWPLSQVPGVALRLDYLVAAGQPEYARGAMFNATGSLYSAASLALEHRGTATRTRLSIGQPLRAESGRGTLRYAVGRDRAGNWRYEQARFALRPETREVRFQLRHDRPLFKGQLAVELSYAHNADHVPGQHRTQAGLGYRLIW